MSQVICTTTTFASAYLHVPKKYDKKKEGEKAYLSFVFLRSSFVYDALQCKKYPSFLDRFHDIRHSKSTKKSKNKKIKEACKAYSSTYYDKMNQGGPRYSWF
jgi:hypothetical protein